MFVITQAMKAIGRKRLARARRLAAKGQSLRAFSLYAPLARKGLPEAQLQVARAYLAGHGVPSCHAEALKWCERAAQGGLVEAQTLAASLRLSQPGCNDAMRSRAENKEPKAGDEDARNLETALYWINKAVEAGCPDAMALLAYLCINGPETMRDLDRSAALYQASAQGGSPQGAMGHGFSLLNSADDAAKQDAFGWISKAADANLPFAFYLFGLLHEHAVGMERDAARAVALYRQAAERGVRLAQLRLGLALLQGNDVPQNAVEGETWLRRAALAGEPAAAAAVGTIYVTRGVLPPNYLEAAKWYVMAADAGHRDAARALGQLYLAGGNGLLKNRDEAALWFYRAATFDDRAAWAELAALALGGAGTDEIRMRTRQWYEIVAKSGDRIAAHTFARFLLNGIGGDRDVAQAVIFLRHAAEEVVEAQYCLGRILCDDNGIAPAPSEGRIFLMRAADAGHVEATNLLAEMVLNGRGGPRDPEKALERFESAAKAGHVGAAFAIGTILCGGYGVRADLLRARELLSYAAQRGHVFAQLAFGRLLLHAGDYQRHIEQARYWLEKAAKQGLAEAASDLERLAEIEGSSR